LTRSALGSGNLAGGTGSGSTDSALVGFIFSLF
jgi:hypothetical protein